jgi:hypothetical protein
MRFRRLGLLLCSSCFFGATFSPELMAYIGPGAGAGLIATVLGVIVALILAVLGIVYYPLKRFVRNWRARRAPSEDGNESDR